MTRSGGENVEGPRWPGGQIADGAARLGDRVVHGANALDAANRTGAGSRTARAGPTGTSIPCTGSLA
ncbi:MAG: hypothetical protein ABW163_06995 [Luteimonas sp.]